MRNNNKCKILGPILLGIILSGLILLRMLTLTQVPGKSFVDEKVSLKNVKYAVKTIQDRDHGHIMVRMNDLIFIQASGGGFTTPLYTTVNVPAIILHPTIYSLRLTSFLFGLIGIAFTILTFKKIVSASVNQSMLLATVLLAVPWWWHQSIIAWDPMLIPPLTAISLYLTISLAYSHHLGDYYKNPRKMLGDKNLIFRSIAIYMCAVALSYSYPPARILSAIILITLSLYLLSPIITIIRSKDIEYKIRKSLWWSYTIKILVMIMMAIVCLIPLILMMFNKEYMLRTDDVAIWSKINPHRTWGFIGLVYQYCLNVLNLLSPITLFIIGDHNGRHGIGGPLGLIGLASFLLIIKTKARQVYKNSLNILSKLKLNISDKKSRSPAHQIRHISINTCIYMILIIYTIAGISGAALTWSGQPHTLRANAGLVPLSLLLAVPTYRYLMRDRFKPYRLTISLIMILITMMQITGYYLLASFITKAFLS